MLRPVDDALSAPPTVRGGRLTELREDQWFERKSARVAAKDLANDLIGMANAEGGVIVIGLHAGRVEGTAAAGIRRNAWRQASVDYTVPPLRARFRSLEVVNDDGEEDELVLAEVEPSDRVHANQRDEVYLRIGDETRRLSYRQRQELEFDKGQSNFETTLTRQLTREDLDETLLAEFAERLGHPNADRALICRGLRTPAAELTVGAALLFARDPQVELPEAHLRVLRVHGTERGTGRRQQIVRDERLEGPLPLQIRRAEQLVGQLVPTRRALSPAGAFTDVGAVPRDAWLEGLVNALTHRSYSVMGDHVRVEILDDRIVIESPGRFPGIVDLDNPQDINRFARNPRIARVLADLGFGQELGEGIRRMFEEMRLAGLAEPAYQQTSGSVRLTLSADPVDRALEQRLPDTARPLLRAIREAERVSTGDVVALTGRSRPSVLRDLRALETAGIVEWVGRSRRDPRAYWRLCT